MQQVEKTGMPCLDANPGMRRKITATHGWMPASGYGPYCTIPISSGIDSAFLRPCGLPSFTGARDEVKRLAEEYEARAAALAARALKERLDLSIEIRSMNGEQLIRPYRVRLCLCLDKPNGSSTCVGAAS